MALRTRAVYTTFVIVLLPGARQLIEKYSGCCVDFSTLAKVSYMTRYWFLKLPAALWR